MHIEMTETKIIVGEKVAVLVGVTTTSGEGFVITLLTGTTLAHKLNCAMRDTIIATTLVLLTTSMDPLFTRKETGLPIPILGPHRTIRGAGVRGDFQVD